jgi:hypothetical protein
VSNSSWFHIFSIFSIIFFVWIYVSSTWFIQFLKNCAD